MQCTTLRLLGSLLVAVFLASAVAHAQGGGTGIEVQNWDNNYYMNAGKTWFSASSVVFTTSGSTVTGSLRYQVLDQYNPTAIAQLFVAVERKVVATLYNGMPGAQGASGSKQFSFVYDQSKYGSAAALYLVGTWTTSESLGIDAYEQHGGGWWCAIGSLRVSTAVSLGTVAIQRWDNGYFWNSGRTGIWGYFVVFTVSGTTVTGSLRYWVFDADNPTAIAQLFVAVGGKVVATLYNGIPGVQGATGSKQFSFVYDPSKYGAAAALYLVGTWTLSESLGIDAYEQHGGGWRCSIGSATSGSGAVSGQGIEVQNWDNNYYMNAGKTWFSASSVVFTTSGSTVTGSLRYQVLDQYNPTAIAQLFVAVERKVVATLYNGMPGAQGASGSKQFSFAYDQSKYGSAAALYLVGTWTTSESLGIDAYEQHQGGWWCAIGSLRVTGGTVSPGTLGIQRWDNGYFWNSGKTGIWGYFVAFTVSGTTVTGSLRYWVYDADNPTAIAQLFVAVERKVVATLYNGIPGVEGATGSKQFSFVYDQSKYGSPAALYLVGTWTLSESLGIDAYEQHGGGWRASIGTATLATSGGITLTVGSANTTQCPQIRLPVTVTSGGQALTGLGAANFTLVEDGQSRSISVSQTSGGYEIAYTSPNPGVNHQVMVTVNYSAMTDSKTTTVPSCSVPCSTVEPALNITLQPGFYIAEVTGSTEGYWGMEALAQRGDLSGGFNLGGGLQEKGTTPAFGGFYLRDTQSVFIRATAQVVPGGNASDFSMCVRLLANNRDPIGTDQCGTTVVELQRTLSSGFYVVQIRSGGSSPRATLQLGLAANYFSGGVDVGGFVAPGLTGFGAFFLPADQGAQEVKIKVLGRPTYRGVGTCNLQLRLLDGNRNLIKTVP